MVLCWTTSGLPPRTAQFLRFLVIRIMTDGFVKFVQNGELCFPSSFKHVDAMSLKIYASHVFTMGIVVDA